MKPINHNLLPWLSIGVVAVVAIFLLWVILRSPNDPAPHSEKEVERITAPVREAEITIARELHQSRYREDSLKRIAQAQAAELDAAKREISRSRQKLARIIRYLDTAKANADTSRFIAAAEEMRNEVESQAGVIQHYEQLADASFYTYEQRLAEKDSIIAKQAELLSKFRSAVTQLEEQNNTLITDINTATRKLKKERVLSKGLALAGIIVGVLVAK